jgi:hypothetical protein
MTYDISQLEVILKRGYINRVVEFKRCFFRARIIMVNGNVYFYSGANKNLSFIPSLDGGIYLAGVDVRSLPNKLCFNLKLISKDMGVIYSKQAEYIENVTNL